MATKEPLIPFSKYDVDNVIADIDAIRKYNPQRYEIEQLTAVVFEDLDAKSIVGYADTSMDDFWVRGHMPGLPLIGPVPSIGSPPSPEGGPEPDPAAAPVAPDESEEPPLAPTESEVPAEPAALPVAPLSIVPSKSSPVPSVMSA